MAIPSALIRYRTRPRGVASVEPNGDPLGATEQAYARNLFVSTVLRRMGRLTLNSLEDAEIAQEWARESRCRRCDREEFQGDHIRRHLRDWLVRSGAPVRVPAPRTPVGANVRFVATVLGLSKHEAAILQFVVVLHRSDRLMQVAHSLGELPLSDAVTAVAAATRLTYEQVAACLSPTSRLLQTGLVTVETERQQLASKIQLKSQLIDVLFLRKLDREAFSRAFLEPVPASTLSRDDFAAQDAVDLASALLRGATSERACGVNILLHGPTGVGKTELARLLGQNLGLQVFAVGRADEMGGSATAPERLASLRLALQLAPRGESILLFDELEDLFRWELSLFTPSRAGHQMSKQWFGALLESNEVPIVWCTNRLDGIDPAFLRRFTYAIELKAPGAKQRATVLARHLGAGSRLVAPDVDAIAQRFDASPAQLATAVRAARLASGGGEPDRATVERLLAPVHKAITGADPMLQPLFAASEYRLDVLNCREDLAALAEDAARFVPGAGPGLSFCLYGAPGTGKSEFVKYLAWRCGRPLVYRRVSDLVSCWVGQTERNIAAAFEEARQDGSILLFDEADSFLRDRRVAAAGWEVTEVNEFLQQLERFPGICACTTNLMHNLDQAALRRFVFKLEFGFLRPEQASAMFASTFPWATGEGRSSRELARLTRLAPGDFAAVSRRIRAGQLRPDAASLIRMLSDEVSLKGGGSQPIGF